MSDLLFEFIPSCLEFACFPVDGWGEDGEVDVLSHFKKMFGLLLKCFC